MSPNARLTVWDARWIDTLLIAMVLFAVLPSGFSWKEADDGATVIEGSLEVKLQWGSLFALSAYVVYRHLPIALANLRAVNPFLLLMLAYATASAIWSPAEGVTVKKAVQVGGLILFALAVQSNNESWIHFVKVIQGTLVSIELMSAVAALTYPSLGIDSYFGYAWRGILSGKNTLGGTAALSVILWAPLWSHGGLSRATRWYGTGLSLLCVVMSTSSTSITIAALGLVVYGLLQRQHVQSPLWLLRLLTVIGLIILVLTHLFYIAEARLPDRVEIVGPFANLFGKSADLTGRSDIWEPLFIEIEKHWIFGIGYGSFWLGPGSAAQPILDRLPWTPYQAHNGYLDLFNELGAVGATLFVGLLLLHSRDLFLMLRFDRTGAATFAAMQITLLVTNLTESMIFRGVTFQFCLFVLICVSASTALARHRRLQTVTPSGPIGTPAVTENSPSRRPFNDPPTTAQF